MTWPSQLQTGVCRDGQTCMTLLLVPANETTKLVRKVQTAGANLLWFVEHFHGHLACDVMIEGRSTNLRLLSRVCFERNDSTYPPNHTRVSRDRIAQLAIAQISHISVVSRRHREIPGNISHFAREYYRTFRAEPHVKTSKV